MGINTVPQVIGLFNHVWVAILDRDDLRESVGIRYASQMWDVMPYWLFWFNDAPGVYRIELQDASALEHYDWGAVFIVKYYPDVTETAFQGLSTLERLLRESDVFDTQPADSAGGCPCHGHSGELHEGRFSDMVNGCGVPHIQYRESIPPDFFFAGHLFIAHSGNAGAVITAKSQTSWRVKMIEDYVCSGDNGSSAFILKKGTVDRNYPGQQITEFVFRRLTVGWKRFFDAPIETESRWEGDGFIFSSDGRTLTAESSSTIRRIILRTTLIFNHGIHLTPIEDDDTDGLRMEFSEREV